MAGTVSRWEGRLMIHIRVLMHKATTFGPTLYGSDKQFNNILTLFLQS